MAKGRKHRLETEPKLAEEIGELIRKPMAATHAAAACGVPKATYFRWLSDAEDEDAPAYLRDFRDVVARAKADAAAKLLSPVLKAAAGLARERYSRDGALLEAWTEYDTASARWLLERMFPDEFGNRQRVELSVDQDDEPIEFDADTEAAARAFLAKATGDDSAA